MYKYYVLVKKTKIINNKEAQEKRAIQSCGVQQQGIIQQSNSLTKGLRCRTISSFSSSMSACMLHASHHAANGPNL